MLEDIQSIKMAGVPRSPSETIDFDDYYLTLDNISKARYREKALACGFDPFKLKKSEYTDDLSLLPAVQYPDIVNYLVLQTSWTTAKEMKAFKAMDAYNFFVSGWVNTLQIKQVSTGSKVVVFARVNHSQRARETPLKTWILSDEDGTVNCAHCTCMAGLAESCSHVGAVLFAIEAGIRMSETTTCTGEKSKWVMPSYVKEIPYKEVCEIDFSSAKKKHQQLQENVTPSPCNLRTVERPKKIPKLSNKEEEVFYRKISEANPKAGILSLVKPHNQLFVQETSENLPKPLVDVLYSPGYKRLTYRELVDEATLIIQRISLTADECSVVEKYTREQASSKAWFSQRGGRITASKLKAACHTNPDKPSRSLIKMICYPGAHRFSTPATRWGCRNEKKARQSYYSIISQQHENTVLSDSGLHIHPSWPYQGASPDSTVECLCCGKGVVEIKCPYKYKASYLHEATMLDKSFCLSQNNAKLSLKTTHEYYYQVQSQLFICDVEYCDFVVWTERDIHIERILPNAEFWSEATTKAKAFFVKGIMPELMGKWFTNTCNIQRLSATLPTTTSTEEGAESDEEGPWCTCQTYIEDSMLIRCDNIDCPIQWYHMECLKLTIEPDGEWFCSLCQKG